MKETVRSLRVYLGIVGAFNAFLVVRVCLGPARFSSGEVDWLGWLIQLVSGCFMLYAAIALPLLLRTHAKALLTAIDVLRVVVVLNILSGLFSRGQSQPSSPVQLVVAVALTLLLFGYLKSNVVRLARTPDASTERSTLGCLVLGLVSVFAAVFFAMAIWGTVNRGGWAQAAGEGKAFGRTKLAADCLAEATARLRRTYSFSDARAHEEFLSGCLETAKLPPDYCTSVPARNEVSQYASWALEICAAHGLPGDGNCGRLVTRIQDRCLPDRLNRSQQ